MQKKLARSLLALSLIPLTAFAEPELSAQSSKTTADLAGVIKPYQTVGNYKDEAQRIYMFVSFDCHIALVRGQGFSSGVERCRIPTAWFLSRFSGVRAKVQQLLHFISSVI